MTTRIGDVVLQAGDNLLLECGDSFLASHLDSTDFQLVSIVGESSRTPRQPWYVMLITLALVASMVVIAAIQSLGTGFLSAITSIIFEFSKTF